MKTLLLMVLVLGYMYTLRGALDGSQRESAEEEKIIMNHGAPYLENPRNCVYISAKCFFCFKHFSV